MEVVKLKVEFEILIVEIKEVVKGKGNGLIVFVNGGKMFVFGFVGCLGWVYFVFNIFEVKFEVNIKGVNYGILILFEYL